MAMVGMPIVAGSSGPRRLSDHPAGARRERRSTNRVAGVVRPSGVESTLGPLARATERSTAPRLRARRSAPSSSPLSTAVTGRNGLALLLLQGSRNSAEIGLPSQPCFIHFLLAPATIGRWPRKPGAGAVVPKLDDEDRRCAPDQGDDQTRGHEAACGSSRSGRRVVAPISGPTREGSPRQVRPDDRTGAGDVARDLRVAQ